MRRSASDKLSPNNITGIPLVDWTPYFAIVQTGEDVWFGSRGSGSSFRDLDRSTFEWIVQHMAAWDCKPPEVFASRRGAGRWWRLKPNVDIDSFLEGLIEFTPGRKVYRIKDDKPIKGTPQLPTLYESLPVRLFQAYSGAEQNDKGGVVIAYPVKKPGSAEVLHALQQWHNPRVVGDWLVCALRDGSDYVSVRGSLPNSMKPAIDQTPIKPDRLSDVTISGGVWTIKINIPIIDPLMLGILNASNPPGLFNAVGDGATVSIPEQEWVQWSAWLYDCGIDWVAADGFDPAAPGTRIVDDTRLESIPGWSRPSPSGRMLHPFQREGVRFLAHRAGRALLADDMGLGKTSQAICHAVYHGGRRNLVICPAGVKSVWRAELMAWGVADDQTIHTLSGSDDRPGHADQWIITSYDQITIRNAPWQCVDIKEAKIIESVVAAFHPDSEEDEEKAPVIHAPQEKRGDQKRPQAPKVVFPDFPSEMVTDAIEKALAPERRERWRKFCIRCRGGMLKSLIDWAPTSLIFDEAHRLKSSDAKRTDAAIRLSGAADSCLLLSGTPIQNRLSEPATMLHVMNPRAYQAVKKVESFSIERIKGLLQPSMIRRLKKDVLTQLPPVTEQIVRMPGLREKIDDEMDEGRAEILNALLHAGEAARGYKRDMTEVEKLRAAWSLGRDPNQYFSIPELGVFGSFEKMRIGAGIVKAEYAVDTIVDVIENRGRVVVFTAHHQVSDLTAKLVSRAGYRTAIIDGRKTPEQRQPIVDAFQAGEIDCLIAGMNAAGEGITLRRADTAVFLEMDVKPSTLRQARDRLHRIGQERQVHAIYMICDHPVDMFFESLCLEKADLTGKVLSESVEILSEKRGETVTKTVEVESSVTKPVPVEPVEPVVTKQVEVAPSVTKTVEPSVTKTVEPAPVAPSVTKTVEPAPVEPSVTKTVEPVAPSVTKTVEPAPVEPSVTKTVEPVEPCVTKTVEPAPVAPSVTKTVEPAPVESCVTKTVEPVEPCVTKTVEPAPVEPCVTKTVEPAPVESCVTKPGPASGAERVARHRARDPEAYRTYMREYMQKRKAEKRMRDAARG